MNFGSILFLLSTNFEKKNNNYIFFNSFSKLQSPKWTPSKAPSKNVDTSREHSLKKKTLYKSIQVTNYVALYQDFWQHFTRGHFHIILLF